MVILSKVSKRIMSLSLSTTTRSSSIIRFPTFGSNLMATFSSSSTNNNKSSNINSNTNLPFRPRRRPPKQLLQTTTTATTTKGLFKKISKKAKEPIKLSNSNSSSTSSTSSLSTLEAQYGYNAATTIQHINKTKIQKGDISPTTLLSSVDETMRLADYLSSATGSTEDLVGERRGLMDLVMDDDDDDDINDDVKEFEKNLKAMMEEQSEFSFKDLPWKEEDDNEEEKVENHNKNRSSNSSSIGNGMQEGEDLNQKAFGPWSETIIKVDRVQKVQRGGTMVRYRALVVGGNLNGCAGFGIAKANAPNEAAAAAARIAKRNLFFVDRYLGTGLTSDLAGRHNSCKVTLRSVNPNRGLHGHPLILEILKYFGISDCSAKSHGNRNVYNVVYATFKALMTHESLEDISLKRGKRLLTLERARRLNV